MTAFLNEQPVIFPRAVLIDRREKAPYSFTGFTTDSHQGNKPLRVLTRVVTLPTGDYSLAGLQDEIAVERKSADDVYHTLGQGRERFERELVRLSSMSLAAVVIEASWHKLLHNPPEHSRLPPKIIFRSIIAWQQEYQRVHWWTVEDRRLGEITTFRILERFCKRRTGKGQP
jgi:hypothetical protein